MFKKILVATDFSTNADAALARAIDLAQHGSRTLEIVHAYRAGVIVLPPPFDLISLGPTGPTLDHVAQELSRRVQLAEANHLHVSSDTLVGDPTEVIAARAREAKVDLIVIGARGLGFVERALVGSVAAKLARHAPCPVLIVPHAT